MWMLYILFLVSMGAFVSNLTRLCSLQLIAQALVLGYHLQHCRYCKTVVFFYV